MIAHPRPCRAEHKHTYIRRPPHVQVPHTYCLTDPYAISFPPDNLRWRFVNRRSFVLHCFQTYSGMLLVSVCSAAAKGSVGGNDDEVKPVAVDCDVAMKRFGQTVAR